MIVRAPSDCASRRMLVSEIRPIRNANLALATVVTRLDATALKRCAEGSVGILDELNIKKDEASSSSRVSTLT